MEIYFAEIKSNNNAGLFYSNLKARTLMALKKLQGIEVDQRSIDVIDDYFYRLMIPKNYFGANGLGVQYRKDFEDACVILMQHIPKDPKTMTTMEYFQTWERLKKSNK